MKTMGLLGGMSWESTVGYYRAINQGVKKALGGLHSARLVMHSVDFGPIEQMLQADDWPGITQTLGRAAQSLKAAGAEFFLICTNTMHKAAPQIEKAAGIPLLHIADATAQVLAADGIQTVGLLGTAITMEHDFYKGRLEDKYGLKVLVPGGDDRREVDRVIFKELCLGQALHSSKSEYLRIMQDLADAGAQAIILGCTEIGMLVSQDDTDVKLYDTVAIHAQKAVEYALG